MGALTSIGILFQSKIPQPGELAERLAARLRAEGRDVWCGSTNDEDAARSALAGRDVVLALGGDGTLLRAARIVGLWGTPLLGINFGKLGYLTEIQPDRVDELLPAYLAGNYVVEERIVLRATLELPGGEPPQDYTALNDVFVGRGATARLVRVAVELDGQPLTTYRADGVVVATPTGSTAYSLAAGGPVLHPACQSLVMTPIAPHVDSPYPLVYPADFTTRLSLQTDHLGGISVDGQIDFTIPNGSVVIIRRNDQPARFLRHPHKDGLLEELRSRFRARHG